METEEKETTEKTQQNRRKTPPKAEIAHRQIKLDPASHRTHPIKDKAKRDRFLFWFEKRYMRAKTEKQKRMADRDWFIVVTALTTAFRAEDLLQLRVKDLIGGYVDIKEAKTGKEARYPLSQFYIDQLDGYIQRNGLTMDDYLFVSPWAEKKHPLNPMISRQRIDRVIADACRYANIPHRVALHGLRKTFGYVAVAEYGKSVETVKVWLNHSSVATTERYIEWGDEDARKESRAEIWIGRTRK